MQELWAVVYCGKTAKHIKYIANCVSVINKANVSFNSTSGRHTGYYKSMCYLEQKKLLGTCYFILDTGYVIQLECKREER